MDKNYDVTTYFKIPFIRPKVPNFVNINKTGTMFIKTQKNLKKNRNYVLKYNLYLYFLI